MNYLLWLILWLNAVAVIIRFYCISRELNKMALRIELSEKRLILFDEVIKKSCKNGFIDLNRKYEVLHNIVTTNFALINKRANQKTSKPKVARIKVEEPKKSNI